VECSRHAASQSTGCTDLIEESVTKLTMNVRCGYMYYWPALVVCCPPQEAGRREMRVSPLAVQHAAWLEQNDCGWLGNTAA